MAPTSLLNDVLVCSGPSLTFVPKFVVWRMTHHPSHDIQLQWLLSEVGQLCISVTWSFGASHDLLVIVEVLVIAFLAHSDARSLLGRQMCVCQHCRPPSFGNASTSAPQSYIVLSCFRSHLRLLLHRLKWFVRVTMCARVSVALFTGTGAAISSFHIVLA